MLDQTDFGNGLRAHLRLEEPEPGTEPAATATEEELTERLHFLSLAQAALQDRERAEQYSELIWRIFEEALGNPDQSTRIAAARALLAEAYGEER